MHPHPDVLFKIFSVTVEWGSSETESTMKTFIFFFLSSVSLNDNLFVLCEMYCGECINIHHLQSSILSFLPSTPFSLPALVLLALGWSIIYMVPACSFLAEETGFSLVDRPAPCWLGRVRLLYYLTVRCASSVFSLNYLDPDSAQRFAWAEKTS